MNRLVRHITTVLLALVLTPVRAFESFEVADIRVEGLQRISAGTVFNYLPVKVGDLLTTGDSEAAMRALFRTGFFNDIYLEREGNVLVVNVKERAAISSIEITGNEDLETEALLEGLEQILSLIHISEPTRRACRSRMPSAA